MILKYSQTIQKKFNYKLDNLYVVYEESDGKYIWI